MRTKTTDPNTEWDYEKLNRAIGYLEGRVYRWKIDGHPKGWQDLQHAIDFIEYNMREGNVVLPTETYFAME